jgi:ankyrin repeat protein
MHTSPLAKTSTYVALTVLVSFVSLSADLHLDSLFPPSFLPHNTDYSTTTAGQTALHEACWSSHPHIVRLLLASGITFCSALCYLVVAFAGLECAIECVLSNIYTFEIQVLM